MNVRISQIARRRGRFAITVVQHLIRLMAGGGVGGEVGEGGGCTLVDLTAPFIKQRTTLWRSEQYRRGPVLRGGGNSAQQAT